MCGSQAAILGTQSAGGVMQTVGSYYASRAKKSALNAQADVMELNAQMADRTAKQALRSGQLQIQQSKLKTSQLKSSQKVGMLSSGIDIAGSESALAVLTTTDVYGAIEAKEIARGALQNAWGYKFQAVNARNQANFSRATARGISPMLNATSTLLSSASDVATSYYMMNKPGGTK